MSFTSYQKVSRIAIVATLFCGLLAASDAEPKPRFVAAQGRIVPGEGVVNVAAATTSGAQPILSQLDVSEGQRVKKGQQLATTSEAAELQRSLSQAQVQVTISAQAEAFAKAQLAAAQEQQGIAALRTQAAERVVARAEAEVNSAQAAQVEAWNRAESAKIRIVGMQEENKRIIDTLSRRNAAELEYEQKKLSLELEELSANQTATHVRMAEEVKRARAGVAAAQADLTIAQAIAQAAQGQVAVSQAAVAQAAAQTALAKQSLTAASARLALGQVYAPIDGTVLQLNARQGETIPQQGLLLLGDTQNLFAEAEVYIDDLRHIRVGKRATVSGDSFAGERKGTVTRIGQVVSLPEVFSRDPASFTDKRVVKVRIRLDSDDKNATVARSGNETAATAAVAIPEIPASAAQTGAQATGNAPATSDAPTGSRPVNDDTTAPQLPVNASVLVRIDV